MSTLSKLRMKQDLTVMEMAKITGLKPSVLSALEHGRRQAEGAEVPLLCRMLSITPTELSAAIEESRKQTALVVDTMNALAEGRELPPGMSMIACSRRDKNGNGGCRVIRGPKE